METRVRLTTGPFLLRRLSQIGAADPERIDALTKEGILTLADLELAIAEERPVASALRRVAHVLTDEQEPLTLGRARDILDPLLARLKDTNRELETIEISGGLRRYEQLPRDLVAVGLSADPPAAIASAARLPDFSDILHRSNRRLIAKYQGHEIDLRVGTREDWGSLLFITTGPTDHVAEVLRRRGRRLCSSEEECYAHIGASYVPPEVRDSPVFSTWRLRDLFPASSRVPTFAATCTCTPRTVTGATHCMTWSRSAARSDTSTSRSPITPSTRRRFERSIAMASSGSATRSRSCASSFLH